MSEVLHAFRALYHKRARHQLHALLLVGVSTVAELVVSSASPFNKDRRQPVTMAAFYPTLKLFLTERKDKNIFNIVQKAKEKPAFMMRLLFNQTPISFSIDNPDMAYLAAHGVIENVGGNVEILVPLYAKRLITAFRPTINGEAGDYRPDLQDLSAYVTGNRLHINALLQDYRAYVQRRGFRAFDTEQLKEGARHYSLDGFLHFFIQRLGCDTLVEVPSGRGRTDILILYQGGKEIIETKVYLDQGYFDQGKEQLVDYLVSEGLDQGFYVVFSNKHGPTDTLYSEETIRGKQLYTWIIRTGFKAPSQRVAKQKRKKS